MVCKSNLTTGDTQEAENLFVLEAVAVCGEKGSVVGFEDTHIDVGGLAEAGGGIGTDNDGTDLVLPTDAFLQFTGEHVFTGMICLLKRLDEDVFLAEFYVQNPHPVLGKTGGHQLRTEATKGAAGIKVIDVTESGDEDIVRGIELVELLDQFVGGHVGAGNEAVPFFVPVR